MFDAIIFDFDGTILDTELPDYLSWRELYDEHGCELDISLWVSRVGTMDAGRFDPHTYLEERVGRSLDREALRARRRARNLELVAAQAVLPGVLDYLSGARNRGLKIGLASSSPREWVHGHLARLGLDHYFDCMCCSDDVARVKPDPELYAASLEALGVSPSQAVAIEDSLNGMRAARAAGIACVVVPNAITRALAFHEADLVLDSLAMMTLDELFLELSTGRRSTP